MANEEKRFGKYLLLSRLAAGGMAMTYRARMTAAAGLTKEVVIKKIHPHLAADETFVQMFIREAKLAASLTHGNIAQVFDFGKTEGDYFLAMELVHGQALSRVLRRSADRDLPFLPVPVALQIACRMCDGLHYAHTRKDERGQPLNLVHRDVSPENTLLSYEGEVKMIDFGIAKSSGGKQTEIGLVKGKYPYFSPEQAQAVRDLDARSDVYAVGVVLFEMLCGRRPYEGEFIQVLAALAEGKVPHPTSFNPGIPPTLEQAMLKALTVRREDRYPSTRDFGQALSEVLHTLYPTSTSNDVSMLLGALFKAELEAEGNPVEVSPEFAIELMMGAQPGYGARRRLELGLKPELKVSHRPSNPAVPKLATPTKPRASKGTATGSANNHGGYRPQTMPMAEPVELGLDEKTPPEGNAVAPDAGVAPQVQSPKADPGTANHLPAVAGKKPPLVVLGGIGAGLLLLIAGYVVFSKTPPPLTPAPVVVAPTALWITSSPSAAAVEVDGKDVGASPVKTTMLPGPHQVTVSLAGFKPWTQRLTATSKPVTLNAMLEVEAAVAVEPPAGAGPAEKLQGSEITSAERNDAHWPLRMFVLRPASNALPLDKYETANLELRPTTTYQLTVMGTYSLGPGHSSATVLYYLEGDMPENKRVGTLTGKMTIKGATRLHAFVLDDDLADNSGALTIEFRVSQYVAPQNLIFDAKKHALVPLPEHRFKVTRLSPSTTYVITLNDDMAATAPGKTGRVGQVLCVETPESPRAINATHRVLEVGKHHRVTGATALTCVFPDLKVDDNSGSMDAEIVDFAELTPEEQARLDVKK